MKQDAKTAKRLGHPGSGRGKARSTTKGRQTDSNALDEIRALLGDRPPIF